MVMSLNKLSPRAALVEIAQDFHGRGWMAGTAGNLSARQDDQHFWITTSGVPKGRIDEKDFLLVRLSDGAIVEQARPGNRPSAETAIHRCFYTLFPDMQACLHGHSVEACLATKRVGPKAKNLRLPPLEMVKGFDIWKPSPKVDLPIFENHLKVERIAEEIGARFKKSPPAISAIMIRDHGPTVWGESLQQAYDRFEILDFLLRYLAGSRR